MLNCILTLLLNHAHLILWHSQATQEEEMESYKAALALARDQAITKVDGFVPQTRHVNLGIVGRPE